MDALLEMKDFYEKIAKYDALVRDYVREFFHTDTLITNMKNLRAELQRSYSRLENTISEYGGKSFIPDPFYVKKHNVFDIAFSPIDTFNFSENLDALDEVKAIVNKAIGKLEKEEESWRIKGKEATYKKDSQRPKAFISHGKGEGALRKLERFLIELGVQPIIVKDQPNLDRTVDKKVEDCLDEADFVIILATGDDKVGNKSQPRQNIIHEIGLAQKTHSGKIIYLLEEGTELPSNIRPKVYETFARQSMDRAFTTIIREIKKLGFL